MKKVKKCRRNDIKCSLCRSNLFKMSIFDFGIRMWITMWKLWFFLAIVAFDRMWIEKFR